MTLQIFFYDTKNTPFTEAIAGLLQKIFSAKESITVYLENPEQVLMLNENLWKGSKNSFLPHGCETDSADIKAMTPIWITNHFENVNQSTILITMLSLFKETGHQESGFQKIYYLFNSKSPSDVTLLGHMKNLHHHQQHTFHTLSVDTGG